MSQRRISQSAGYVVPGRLPRGPNGRALCRRCGVEVPGGRRTFCGDDCVHAHKIESDPGYVRRRVSERDKGVCAVCGVDTTAARSRLRDAVWAGDDTAEWARDDRQFVGHEPILGRCARLAPALGIPVGLARLGFRRSWWDADHIVPVVEGGGECGLDGYRTLCVPCHRDETAKLARRRAEARRGRVG